VGLGERMSEECPSGSSERPEAQPSVYPIGQPPGSNPQGPKPFWRRPPFLMAAPPLTLVVIVAIVGCVSASTSSPASAGSPSASAGGSPSALAASPSASAASPSASAASPSASPTSYAAGCTSHACIAAVLDQNLTGLVAQDEAVSTKVTCYVSTVVYYSAAGTYSADCTVTYSDGSSAYGTGNLVTSSGEVTFDPS
jgi:hypothetical protein